ncbi:MAG: hypothetical protein ACK4SY_00100 [Pyrobaculum sp.]
MKCVKTVGYVPEIGLGTFGTGGDFWSRDSSKHLGSSIEERA